MEGFFKILFGRPRVRRRYHRKTVSSVDRESARALVHARLAHFNQFYQLQYNKVFIKNQRTRWGSCSSNRNLNFNYRIITLAPELQDYLVVHELCHLQEFNHSQAFWDLVALQISNYETLRTQLRGVD
jgi:hypothetical protein